MVKWKITFNDICKQYDTNENHFWHANSVPIDQKIPLILWKMKNYIQQPSMVPIISQINPINTSHLICLKSILIRISFSSHVPQVTSFFYPELQTKIFHTFLILQYSVNKNHETPHYTIFSIRLLRSKYYPQHPAPSQCQYHVNSTQINTIHQWQKLKSPCKENLGSGNDLNLSSWAAWFKVQLGHPTSSLRVFMAIARINFDYTMTTC
jgi:hypothetical protein